MNEQHFYCAYLKKAIDAGLCYDIQMIVTGHIKPSALPNINLEYESLNNCCRNCRYRQL